MFRATSKVIFNLLIILAPSIPNSVLSVTLQKCPSGEVPDDVISFHPSVVNSKWDLEFNLTEAIPEGCSAINLANHTVEINNNTDVHVPKHRVDYYWADNGYFQARSDAFHPKSYCIWKISAKEIQVQTCLPNCSSKTNDGVTCVKKCCPLGHYLALNLDTKTGHPACQPETFEWKPLIYNSSASSDLNRIHYAFSDIMSRTGCRTTAITPNPRGKPFKYAWIRLLRNGSVLTRVSGNHQWESPAPRDDFCVDAFESQHDDDPEVNNDELAVLICAMNKPRGISRFIYIPVLTISAVFAAVTVIIYLLLWDVQNLHGWTVATFSGCTLAFLIFNAAQYGIGELRTVTFGSDACIFVAVGGHFFYIGMFAWSTVLCFDLWSALRVMGPRSRNKKGFLYWLCYASFGFGAPTLVVACSYWIDKAHPEMNATVYRPQYGRVRCGVDGSSLLYYLLFPSLILYIINLIIAALMVNTLLSFRKVRNNLRSGGGKGKSTAMLYVKLFMIMGLSWGFEFISYLDKSNSWIWIAFDVLNLLQAVGIFIIFVCKVEVKEQLSRKYSFFRALFSGIERGLGKSTAEIRPLSMKTTYVDSYRLSCQSRL